MATLLIRNLDDEVREKLRVRAAVHGRSMEAEARDILNTAIAPERDEDDSGSAFVDEMRSIFDDLGGVELPYFPDQAFQDYIDVFGDDLDDE